MEIQNDELVIEIGEIVRRAEIQIQSSTQRRICKVPRHIRNWKEEAYTPQVVSIGPIHHKNERLKAMEVHKERYFRSFIKRREIKLEYLVGTIREMEESIRGCYEETIDLTSDEFVKMILVDACFILELLFRCSSTIQTSDDPMLVQLRAKAMMLDLILLENQLPFYVIEKLHFLSFPSLPDYGLLQLSFDYFRYFNIQSIPPHPNVEIEHFTHLLRTFQLPPPEQLPKRAYHNSQIDNFYSATQLYEEGVKFEFRTSKSYFDIKFERGVLKIPRLEFDDWIEVVTRNIMALEQTRYIENAYFTDYFLFMDSLIRTRKDVDLLCDKHILVNHLGDSYAAESMIQNLNKGILWIGMRDDYVDLCKKLERFCFTPCSWYKWMAMFRHSSKRNMAMLSREFFGTPSVAASTIVSLGVITVLTLIQTVCSVMQVTDSSRKAV